VKAVAVFPGKPGSAHLTQPTEPSVDDVADRRGVLVIGHERFEVVEQVGRLLERLSEYVHSCGTTSGSKARDWPPIDPRNIRAPTEILECF
jgi:hypothetical protein